MKSFLAGCPEAVQRLDLHQPGWLEASAGSGKTYAIEHLVVRLLRESPGLTLSQILLVTFTEKAAGELKEKIRRRLASACSDPELDELGRWRLVAALQQFDRASVYTIHAFCMQSLKRYAFELRGLFDAALTSEEAVRDTALLQLHRLAAQGALPQEQVQALVACANGPFRSRLQNLAVRFRPHRGDSLAPQPVAEKMTACESRFREAIQSTRQWLFPEGSTTLDTVPWMVSLVAAAKGRTKQFELPSREKAYERLWNVFHEYGDDFDAWHSALTAKNTTLGKKGPGLFRFEPELPLSDSLRTWMQTAEQKLRSLIDAARAWHEAWDAHQYQDLYLALTALSQAMEGHKSREGWLTYDDMAMRLWEALQQSPDLVALLRQQFPVAIVDEFQDTDPVQWGLFESLYLQMQPPGPLFLVGDPKQAIYGFRGGDLQTYLRARQRIQTLSQSGQAMGLSLPANFRSRENLIEACNLIFGQQGWFQTDTTQDYPGAWQLPQDTARITFIPALYGHTPKQHCDDPGPHPAPVWLLKPVLTQKFDKAADLRQVLRNQWDYGIAKGIRDMLSDANGMRIPDGHGSMRPLHPGDICVLHRAHKDRLGIERWLRQWNIPYHVHKKRGLFKSPEAGHLAAVLNAVAHPQDPKSQIAAHFCELVPGPEGEVPAKPEPNADTDSRQYEVMHPSLQALLPYASNRQWPVFFRRLLKASGWAPTLSHRGEEATIVSPEKWTRYQQLAQRLTEAAQTQGLDAYGLAQCLQDWRKTDDEDMDAESDTLRSATTAAQVTFLTMHVSKGLEFPVVFIAGGFGRPRIGEKRVRQNRGMGWTWFMNTPQSATGHDESEPDEDDSGEASETGPALSLREQWLNEAKQEDLRLFYVALTRAQFKLVLPYFPDIPDGKPSVDSPWKGFVGQAIRFAMEQKPDLFAVMDIDPGMPEPEGNAHLLSLPHARHSEVTQNADAISPLSLAPLETETHSYLWRRRGLASYSQLAHRRQQMLLDEQGKRLTPDDLAPMEEEKKPALTPVPQGELVLPPGARTGNFLHACLENLPFHLAWVAADLPTFQTGPALPIVQEQLAFYEMKPDLASEALRILWKSLRTPLPNLVEPDKTFCLAQVTDRLAELEFMMPYGHSEPLPDMRNAGGYLWGYIDLVFRHAGRYYVLDWKSNSLPDYSPGALAESMREEAYDLQGRLYALALHRWLQGRLPGYQPEAHFGGVFYLYLRGMKGDSPAETTIPQVSDPSTPIERSGVAAWRPTRTDLEVEYPHYLSTYLGVSPEALRSDAAKSSPGSAMARGRA